MLAQNQLEWLEARLRETTNLGESSALVATDIAVNMPAPDPPPTVVIEMGEGDLQEVYSHGAGDIAVLRLDWNKEGAEYSLDGVVSLSPVDLSTLKGMGKRVLLWAALLRLEGLKEHLDAIDIIWCRGLRGQLMSEERDNICYDLVEYAVQVFRPITDNDLISVFAGSSARRNAQHLRDREWKEWCAANRALPIRHRPTPEIIEPAPDIPPMSVVVTICGGTLNGVFVADPALIDLVVVDFDNAELYCERGAEYMPATPLREMGNDTKAVLFDAGILLKSRKE